MGLAFHYSACIRKQELIKPLVTEVEDICQSMNWEYTLWDKVSEFPATSIPKEPGTGDPKSIHLQGILFTPPECETVSLLFTPSGRMTAFPNLLSAESYVVNGLDIDLIYTVSVKTQYAGVDLHIALMNLLKYLEGKYLTDMEVSDEGEYWERMDKNYLAERFAANWAVINAVKDALSNAEFKSDRNADTISDQLLAILRKELGDGFENKTLDNTD